MMGTSTVPTYSFFTILDTSYLVEAAFETVEGAYRFACTEKTTANHFDTEDNLHSIRGKAWNSISEFLAKLSNN